MKALLAEILVTENDVQIDLQSVTIHQKVFMASLVTVFVSTAIYFMAIF